MTTAPCTGRVCRWAAKRAREPIRAADHLVEALAPDLLELLAQRLGGGAVEQRLLAAGHRHQLDRLAGEAGGLAQLQQRLLVVGAHPRAFQRVRAQLAALVGCQRVGDLRDGGRPEIVRRGRRGFVGRQPITRIERLRVGDAHALAAREVVRLRIAVHERANRHAERRKVTACQLVALGDAHRARLAVAPVGEAQRARAAPDMALVGFEQRDAVPALLELVCAHEARKAGPDDDDRQRSARIGCGGKRGQRGVRRARARQRHQAAQELAPRARRADIGPAVLGAMAFAPRTVREDHAGAAMLSISRKCFRSSSSW
jgi:hypothetical protein